ncbi:MAG: hypothetical protein WA990_09170 [Rubrobacteraceae bacterium]
MERVILPELYCPFLPAINEHAEEVQENVVNWTRSFGLLPEQAYRLFDETGLGRLAARTHPDLSRDDLQLVSEWYTWLFLRDDKGDESEVGRRPDELSEVDNRFLDVLAGGAPGIHDEPLVHALYDLRERLQGRLHSNGLSGVWMRRFVRTFRGHLEATLWEAANRARGVVPDLESYLRMRPLTGGLSIVTELIEIIEGNHLPQEVREHAAVRRVTEASHNIVCWANDILSLEKELKCNEVNNLILVLHHTQGLDLQRATDRAAGMHDAEMRALVEQVESFPVFGGSLDGNLERYVSSLRHRIRGVLDWSYESGRYKTQSEVVVTA